MCNKDKLNPYGFGNEQYSLHKEVTAFGCTGCGFLRATANGEEPEHKCPICGKNEWTYIRKFL